MSDAKLEMKIPEQFIADTIRAEIIRQMPNKEEFAAKIVTQAMSEKARDSYGYANRDQTVFQKAVADMINEEAKRIFGEWLEQHRTMIRDAMVKELTRSKAALVKKIAEQMANGLTRYHATVSLNVSAE